MRSPTLLSAALLLSFTSLALADVPIDQIGLQNVLVVLSDFPSDTLAVPFDTTVARSMVQPLDAWFAENSYDHSAAADSSITRLALKIVGWYTISDSGGTGDHPLNANRALTAVVADASSGVTAATVSTYDRFIFLFSGLYGRPNQENGQWGPPDSVTFSSTVPSGEPGYFPPFKGKSAQLYHFSTAFVSTGDILHEFLHTYSLTHARSFSSISNEVREYGSLFEVMGSHNVPLGGVAGTAEITPHIQAVNKEFFGWIDPIPIVSTSGSYKIGPLETALGVPNDNPRALKIDTKRPRISAWQRYYYLEARRPIGFDVVASGNRFNVLDGLVLNDVEIQGDFQLNSSNPIYSHVIDCTPETPMDQSYDCGLMVDRSFVDEQLGVCITPTAIVQDTVSVTINFLADFPNNEPPTVQNVFASIDSSGPEYLVTFEALAADPNGDVLSYFWNFDVDLYKTRTYPMPLPDTLVQKTAEHYTTGTFGSGETATHTYASNAPRRAFLRVSDRKGGQAPWYEVRLWNWTPDTLYVGPGEEFGNISAALAAASGGNVVLVRSSGSPYTGPLNANLGFDGKRVLLRGETPDVTIDLTGTGLRAFKFTQLETGRAAVQDLRVVGGDVRATADPNGGAVEILERSRPVFTNCTFESCSAGRGGAVFTTPIARGIFRQCTFRANSADHGGALYIQAGFGEDRPVGGLTLDECTVVRNYANMFGGGVAFWEGGLIPETSTLTIVNSLVTQNAAARDGGGVYFSSTARRGPPKLIGNSIIDNLANFELGGGHGHGVFIASDVDSVVMTNSILWDHWDRFPWDPVLEALDPADTTRVFLRNCLVRSWWDTGSGNILNTDPGCADPRQPLDIADGDYSLVPFSPCVDSGRWLMSDTVRDRYLNPRYDDASVANQGTGGVPYVDVGAIERQEDSGTKVTMAQEYTKEIEKVVVGESVSFVCDERFINVGRHSASGNVYTDRSGIDFDTGVIPDAATIDKVELELKVYDGLGGSLEVRARSAQVQGSACNAGGFNNMGGGTLYSRTDGWNVPLGTTKTVVLGTQANSDLQSRLGTQGSADGWFAVALKAYVEDFDDVMEIYPSSSKLRVTYH